MTENSSNCEVVVALNQFSGSKPMPGSITEHALTNGLRNPVESVADAVFRPCIATGVEKQLALPALCHQALDNIQCDTLKVNNTFLALALGFLNRKYNPLMLHLDMPGFYMPGFLRPATGIPDKLQQAIKRIIRRKQAKDGVVIGLLHVDFTTLSLRLLDLFKRGGLNIAHFLCPVINALYGHNSPALIGVSPCTTAIGPFDNMIGFDIKSWKVSDTGMFKKAVKMALVPFITAGCAVIFAPREIFYYKLVYSKRIFHVQIIT